MISGVPEIYKLRFDILTVLQTASFLHPHVYKTLLRYIGVQRAACDDGIRGNREYSNWPGKSIFVSYIIHATDENRDGWLTMKF
jgi:hypothetical protein